VLTHQNIDTIEFLADEMRVFCDALEGGVEYPLVDPEATLLRLLHLHGRLVRCVEYVRAAHPNIPERHEAAALELCKIGLIEMHPFWRDKYADIYQSPTRLAA